MNSESDIQQTIINNLLGRRFSHLITLNPNRPMRDATLRSLLRLWTLNVGGRLFRGAITKQPQPEDLFSFDGFLEFTSQAGHPHYHLLAQVHPSAHARLAAVAALRWSRILAGAHCHVVPLGGTKADLERTAVYVTKDVNQERCFAGFVTSHELNLPRFYHSAGAAIATGADALPDGPLDEFPGPAGSTASKAQLAPLKLTEEKPLGGERRNIPTKKRGAS